MTATDDLPTHPLTVDQRRLWFLQQLDPTDSAYHLYLAHRWVGPLDRAALRTALDGLVERHEILRTRYVLAGEEPRQVVHPPAPVDLVVRRLPADATEAEFTEAFAPYVNAPFELATEPPLRAVLVSAGEQDHALCLVLHHIAADGWSADLIQRELIARYRGRVPGELPYQYGVHARAEHARLAGGAAEQAYAHWQARLAGAAPLRLPTDRPRPARPEHPAGFTDLDLGPELTAAVDRLAREQRCTPFMVLLAAYQILLGRWCGQQDFTVGTPLSGRTERAQEELVGSFTRTAVIRADLRGAADFRTVLRRVRSATMDALAHQDVPLERLAADQGTPPGALPFRTLFVFQSQTETGAAPLELPDGVELLPMDSGFARAKADLLLDNWRTPTGLTCSFSYDLELLDRATVEALAARYRTLLAHACADPLTPVHGDWLLDPAERADLLARSAGPALPTTRRRPLLERFAEQVALRPHAPALALGPDTLDYAELDRRSSRLAARIGPLTGRVAAVRIAPSYDLVVALLAIWKAGGAYLPLDAAHPVERLRQLVADGNADLLLADPGGPDLGLPVVTVGELADGGASVDYPPPAPGDAAYVLFTSGSTGRPKGVVVEHGALADRIDWMAGDGYRLDAADRIVQFASIGFDTHAEEIWPALASGACVVLLPGGGRTLPDLLRTEAGRQVTVLDLPTAYWHELVLLGEEFAWPAELRLVVLGGSAMEPAALARWHQRHGDRIRLVNTYGPTEATVIATAAELTAAELTAAEPVGAPPIGHPLPGVRCYVLDRQLGLVPDGSEGELFLAGAGLARGYTGRPDLTADRFLPDPYGALPGARMYRTGDRVRRHRGSGALEFLGRTDAQVKIRGQRVEPGEVEHVLAAHPAVAHAVVLARGDRLLGYAVPAPGEAPGGPELLDHLAQRLPAFMVPAAITVLDRLPLTPNGKPDLAALPEPGPAAAGAGYLAPRTDAEQLVADIWREVLGVDKAGALDDFFALGGDSLRVTRVAARIRSLTGLDVTIREVFEHPVLAALAERVEALLIAEIDALTDAEAADRLG
ncbi:amino acid adenylation domain-containing protein [Kitasatospora sp. NPDC094015]|uniref:amino acid adenylation domain-containing protein n=1 Tax=Kitasatospora sp. NPDC094015 TaxID=3155205 RepID=UPI003324A62E